MEPHKQSESKEQSDAREIQTNPLEERVSALLFVGRERSDLSENEYEAYDSLCSILPSMSELTDGGRIQLFFDLLSNAFEIDQHGFEKAITEREFNIVAGGVAHSSKADLSAARTELLKYVESGLLREKKNGSFQLIPEPDGIECDPLEYAYIEIGDHFEQVILPAREQAAAAEAAAAVAAAEARSEELARKREHRAENSPPTLDMDEIELRQASIVRNEIRDAIDRLEHSLDIFEKVGWKMICSGILLDIVECCPPWEGLHSAIRGKEWFLYATGQMGLIDKELGDEWFEGEFKLLLSLSSRKHIERHRFDINRTEAALLSGETSEPTGPTPHKAASVSTLYWEQNNTLYRTLKGKFKAVCSQRVREFLELSSAACGVVKQLRQVITKAEQVGSLKEHVPEKLPQELTELLDLDETARKGTPFKGGQLQVEATLFSSATSESIRQVRMLVERLRRNMDGEIVGPNLEERESADERGVVVTIPELEPTLVGSYKAVDALQSLLGEFEHFFNESERKKRGSIQGIESRKLCRELADKIVPLASSLRLSLRDLLTSVALQHGGSVDETSPIEEFDNYLENYENSRAGTTKETSSDGVVQLKELLKEGDAEYITYLYQAFRGDQKPLVDNLHKLLSSMKEFIPESTEGESSNG